MGENGRKIEDTSYETEALGNPVCSKDKCSPFDIRIVYFI